MTEGRFAADTAVDAVDDGRYLAEVRPGWGVGGAPNGGYLMALAARAMAHAAGRPDPLTITAHYLSPAREEPVTIDTELVQVGKRRSTVQASILQDGREVVRLLGAFGDLSEVAETTWLGRTPPERHLPLELSVDMGEAAERAGEVDGPPTEDRRAFPVPPIFDRIELRMPPAIAGWNLGEPVGEPVMGGWCRLRDEEEADTFALLLFADVFPPAIFNLPGAIGWTPTIELTVQVRRRPAPGWLAAWFTTDAVAGGYLDEDGEVWDETGELVALSRQLALAPRGRR